MLRAEVYARALRASQNVKENGGIGGRAMRLMSGRGVDECSSGRHSNGGSVISKVSWLSLCAFPAGILFSAAQPCYVGGRERQWKALSPRWKQFMVRLLLWSWAQGVGVAIAASKRAWPDGSNGTRTRTNANSNGTEANAAGRSVRACAARESKRERERRYRPMRLVSGRGVGECGSG